MRDKARDNAWARASQRTYLAAYNSWVTYCRLLSIDPKCQVTRLIEMEELVANYVIIQCSIRRLAPTSITKTYLPGIAACFDSMKIKNSFREASNSKEIKLLSRGLQRSYNLRNPAAGRIKLPFGMDLALRAKIIMVEKNMLAERGRNGRDIDVLRERTFVAMAVGIHFMLRKSEHIHSASGVASPIKRKHLTFFDEEDQVIPYLKVGLIKAKRVISNVEFAKADHYGYGRRVTHMTQPDQEVCIVCILEKWIKKTRDEFGTGQEAGLYKINGMEEFTIASLHSVMQATIKSLNIPGFKKSVTSHSLRYGGATMMAAAGFPQYLVAHYGGWAPDSKALKIYAKPTEEMSMMVSKHFAEMSRKEPSRHFILDACAQGRT